MGLCHLNPGPTGSLVHIRLCDLFRQAAEGLDLNMTTYDVVAMGNRIGILEVVERCNTVANIMRDDTTNAKNSSFQVPLHIVIVLCTAVSLI